MKRFLFLSVAAVLMVQIIYYVVKDPHITEAELEYKKAVTALEGQRAKKADSEIQSMRGTMSEEAYAKLLKQQNWMNDFERKLGTYNLNELENKPGYVGVATQMVSQGDSELTDLVAIPLFVYQTGYRYLFGDTDHYVDYIRATMVILLMLFWFLIIQQNYEAGMKFPARCQLLLAVGIVVLTSLPELIWVIWNFGLSGNDYSIHSIADIGGGTIAGMIRTLFIIRTLGVLMLESLFIFLNRLYNKPWKAAGIVAGISILPIWIVCFWNKSVFAGSFGNLIVGTNALRYSYEYVGGLCLMAVIVIVFCRFFQHYHYSEEEIEKMKKHFHD